MFGRGRGGFALIDLVVQRCQVTVVAFPPTYPGISWTLGEAPRMTFELLAIFPIRRWAVEILANDLFSPFRGDTNHIASVGEQVPVFRERDVPPKVPASAAWAPRPVDPLYQQVHRQVFLVPFPGREYEAYRMRLGDARPPHTFARTPHDVPAVVCQDRCCFFHGMDSFPEGLRKAWAHGVQLLATI